MKFIILLMLFSISSSGQHYFNKSYPSDNTKHVIIDNFKGDIKVRPTNTASIKVKVTKNGSETIKELELKEFVKDDFIALYIDNPCKQRLSSFDPDNPFEFLRVENNCNWGDFDERSLPELNFEIEIPKDMNIYVSTIMEGTVDIKDISGRVHASNVNGPIVLENVSKVTNGTTVNGDVDVSFNSKPSSDARFSTINGEINLNVPKNTSLTTNFKSWNGDLYTDLDAKQITESLQDKDKLEAGEIVKIGEYSKAQIGSGDVAFFIETFNGNAYLKKNK